MRLNRGVLIIAIILAAVTTFGVYAYIKSIEAEVSNVKLINVWVAKEDIPAKTKIDESMLVQKEIHEDYVMKNAVLDANSIVGKVTIDKILHGEQIITERLLEKSTASFSYQIPVKKRAVTITVDDVTGVVNLIKPGDFVDVLVFMPETTIQELSNTAILPDITKLVLQNIQVLAVNRDYGQGAKEAPSEGPRKITMAVSPEDSEKLILASNISKIHLALRNSEDKTSYDTPGSIRTDILPEKGKRILN